MASPHLSGDLTLPWQLVLFATNPGYLLGIGETEWTINGRYTGVTELELTDDGKKQVLGSGRQLVGPGKLVDPAKVAKVFVSPRVRAQTTFQLLFGEGDECIITSEKVTVTEDIAEWGYGDYEGMLTPAIMELRKKNGLDKDGPWDIWRDGCEGEGGE